MEHLHLFLFRFFRDELTNLPDKLQNFAATVFETGLSAGDCIGRVLPKFVEGRVFAYRVLTSTRRKLFYTLDLLRTQEISLRNHNTAGKVTLYQKC